MEKVWTNAEEALDNTMDIEEWYGVFIPLLERK